MGRTFLGGLARGGALLLFIVAAIRFAVSGFIPATRALRGDFAAAFPTAFVARWRPDFPTTDVLGADHGLWNYGPMFHFLTMPLLAVPRWTLVPLVWAIVNVGALAVSFLLTWRLRSRPGTPSMAPVVAVAALWLLFQPAVNCLSQGNIEILEMTIVLAGCAWVRERRDAAGGGALALASLIKVLPAGFLAWLVLRRRWRALASAAAFLIGVCSITAVTLQWDHSLTRRSSMAIVQDNPQAGFHELSITSLFMHRASRLDESTPEPRWFPVERRTAAAHAGQIASLLVAFCYVGLLVRAARDPRAPVTSDEIGVLLLLMLLLPPWNHDYYYLFALAPMTWLVLDGSADDDRASVVLALIGYAAISPPVPYGLVDRIGFVRGSFAYALNYHDVPLIGALILLFAATRRLLMRDRTIATS
jgi:hypothetical protein